MRQRAAAMMNVMAIGLVLSTLAAAGVWSPAPPPSAQQHGDHVVREGRRVVIVEYERERPLSPGVKEVRVLSDHGPLVGGEGGDKVFHEAGGVVSDAAGKVAGAAEEGEEKMSDAKVSAKGGDLGAVKRCKDRLCGAGRKVEEGAKDATSRVEHGAEDAVRGAKEMISDAKDSAENKAYDAASQGKETVKSARDKIFEAAGKAKEKESDIMHGAAEAAKSAKDRVSEAAKNAKDSAEDTVKSAKDRVADIAERAEEYAEDAAERAADKAAEAEEAVKAKAGEVTKNLTDIARRAWDVASDAAAYLLGGPREAVRTATAVMHLLGFATAYGTCVWVTFVSSYVLASELPRQQLGMLQSKLFPLYFRAMAYGVGLVLAAHLLGRERSSLASRAQSFNVLAALSLILANMLLLEPKATKVMFERMKVEKEEGRGRDMADIDDPPAGSIATTATNTATAARAEAAAARTAVDGVATTGDAEMSKSRMARLNKRHKKLNSYSSLCNVLSLMALTWHLVHLARRLQTGTAC
ncbi:uncharacterized protein LOC133888865 [Phragmites australis]|uniref:uncharacterized protein LOC133888865 n=1 Tax=Phragmites australis TaxID=29695 RepID=UPI002D787A05|nr:uncharacterized protein LOC133888865 [Phragmites australis]